MVLRKMVLLSECLPLFPDLADSLDAMNRALRNINFGKMDYLPYEEEIPGYHFAMRTDLIPQGAKKPPAMGHWQLEVTRDNALYSLYMQGKAKDGQELGEISFPCGRSTDSDRFFPESENNSPA